MIRKMMLASMRIIPSPLRPRIQAVRPLYQRGLKMASMVVGESGREYMQENVLQRHPKSPELSIYQARQVSSFMPEYPTLLEKSD